MMSPQHETTFKAGVEVLKNGADKAKNRALYELYNPKTVVNAALSSPKTNNISPSVAQEMEKES